MSDTSKKNIFAVILAAGSASRFGATKQLAEANGTPLVRRAVDAATGACGRHTALIIGHEWQSVSEACMPLDGFLIVNDHFTNGIGSSIALATRSLRHAADAIIFLLADQPLVTAKHVRLLKETWSGADNEIVATAFADTLGPPVLFPRACFDALAVLDGDSGARQLFDDERFTVTSVVFEDAALDIDTPEDLRKL